jgi:tryptophan-rich sensory protein
MKLSRMLDPRGTKYAYLVLAMVLNIAWALLFFSLMDSMMLRYGELMQGVDTTLMLGIFLGALSIGFLITLVAKDRRGPTYGIYGGIAGLVVIVLMTWKSGLLAALVGFMAIFGGINGGTLGEMSQQIQRKKNNK